MADNGGKRTVNFVMTEVLLQCQDQAAWGNLLLELVESSLCCNPNKPIDIDDIACSGDLFQKQEVGLTCNIIEDHRGNFSLSSSFLFR